MVAVYDLVWGRTAERIRTKESTGILCQGKALLESTLWLERFPQAVLFRLKAILQDNGTRVTSPLAREGRGNGRGVKQTALNPPRPSPVNLFRGRGVHVHHERKVHFRVKNLNFFMRHTLVDLVCKYSTRGVILEIHVPAASGSKRRSSWKVP